jgi:isochorismate synthase
MGFVAYALPGEKEWVCIKGDWLNLGEESSDVKGFLVSTFSGDTSVLMNAQLIELNNDLFKDFIQSSSKSESQETYLNNVDSLINELNNNDYSKIVYSRSKFVDSDKSILDVVESLLKEDENAFRYVMKAPNNEIWMGASPEVLLSQKNGVGKSMALAGTQKATEKPLESYVWGEKEIEEHEYVVDFISTIFEESDLSFEKGERFTSLAGPITHLKTNFNDITPLIDLTQLLSSLHPTPAVCGIPVVKTKSKILATETRDRSYYTGLIGLVEDSHCDIFINLRSMKKVLNGYELFVGGGITKDSNSVDEWEETELKSQTLMKSIL